MREVLVLAAALTIPDPRERPADREEAARHEARPLRRRALGLPVLPQPLALSARSSERSCPATQFRRMCRDEFLHYLRIREWQDLVGQLRSIARDLGIREIRRRPAPADPGRVHAALLAGLLSHVGMRREDGREYLGARNSRFVLAPGSVLAKRPPRWVVVAELVETSRLFGRTAARIEPEVVERVAGELVQRTYSEPHWDAQRGEVMAYERVTLYGLPLVARRRVGYAARRAGGRARAVHPARARRGRLAHPPPLLSRQRRAARRARGAGGAGPPPRPAGRRRRDLRPLRRPHPRRRRLRAALRRLVEEAAAHTPDLLTFTRDDLLRTEDADGTDQPDAWRTDDVALPLSYRFEPGAADDGVTVHVPVDVLARLGGDEFAWQVPALREELVTALIRSLPKDLRRNFVPAPDTARAVLSAIDPAASRCWMRCSANCAAAPASLVPIDAFDLDKLPAAPAGDVRRRVRRRRRGRPRQGPGRAAGAARRPGPRRRRRGLGRASWSGAGCAPGPTISTSCRASSSARSTGAPCAGFPASSTPVRAVDLRVFATAADQRRRDGPGHAAAAPAGRAVTGESR